MTWEVIGWIVGAFVIVMAIVGFVRYQRWLQEIGRREDKRREDQNTDRSTSTRETPNRGRTPRSRCWLCGRFMRKWTGRWLFPWTSNTNAVVVCDRHSDVPSRKWWP